jgi:hypothetical protein
VVHGHFAAQSSNPFHLTLPGVLDDVRIAGTATVWSASSSADANAKYFFRLLGFATMSLPCLIHQSTAEVKPVLHREPVGGQMESNSANIVKWQSSAGTERTENSAPSAPVKICYPTNEQTQPYLSPG